MELDLERAQKRQALKLFVTESMMVLFAVIMVIVLISVVSGYWINENFEVSRSGMLQVSSMPTGAVVTVDDESWLQRTNASRVIPTGEHKITVAKDGYDSWSKTVDIKEGLLYRLHYPRLFPDERKVETMPIQAGMVSVSKKRDLALLMNDSTKWMLMNLDDEKMTTKELDLSELLTMPINVLSIEWSNDGNRLLLNYTQAEKNEWLLLDLNDVKRSVKVSSEFGIGFTDIKIVNNAASELLALRDGILQKIDLNSRSLSGALAEKVSDFYCRGNDVVFVSETADGVFAQTMRLGKDEVKVLLEVSKEAKVMISRFYDSKYLIVLDGQDLTVYNQENTGEVVFDATISFVPSELTLARTEDFVVAGLGNTLAALDLESNSLREWKLEGATYGWADDFMVYTIADGSLAIYDFDGLNRREVADNVSKVFPVTIINKWLYYVSGDNLVREWLIN